MSNILITGGAGYIGSHAVKRFLEAGHRVTVVDSLYRGYGEVIEILKRYGDLEFYKLDLKDPLSLKEVVKERKFDCVLHFAALCLVSESMEKPEDYFENNVFGTLNLLRFITQEKIPNIIFSSTCAVYGESQYLPIDENHPKNPTNPYGESKLMAEAQIKWMSKIHGFKYLILRYFNVCGASEDGVIGDSKKPSVLLVQNAVRGALGLAPFEITCPTVETPDTTPIRDYIDVNDLIDAHYAGFEHLNNNGSSAELNLGTGKGTSVEQIIKSVETQMNVHLTRNKGEPRKGEYAQVYASNQKAKETLKWYPHRDITQSIDTLEKWYMSHPQGFTY